MFATIINEENQPAVSHIIKRDGRRLDFERTKIAEAIAKAFRATHVNARASYFLELARQAEADLLAAGLTLPTVEQIQDAVEKTLMQNGHVRVAKAYILYRAERTRAREMNTRLMKIYEDITFNPSKNSDIKRENANVNGDTAMGTMLKYGSEGSKQFYEMFVLKPEHSKAHRVGDIHIHDLDFLTMTTTCCQIDIVSLFRDGFTTGHGVLREPADIASYAALACIAIQANQNDQHGGQSIVNFDYGLALGVRKTYRRKYRDNLAKALELRAGVTESGGYFKDLQAELLAAGLELRLDDHEAYTAAELARLQKDHPVGEETLAFCQDFALRQAVGETDRATYQAMEALIHNLNTMHSRAGAQTPFSSINYGMDTSPEGRLVIKNVLLAQEAGLGHGETPIFPIHIFRVKEGVNYFPTDPGYDLFRLACRVSAKRMFPNFSFQDATFNKQYYREGRPETEIAYMGCRTRVIGNVFDPSREITYRRGNLSYTSINLPRIALKANRSIEWFFEELDRKIDLVVEQLLERFEIQAQKTVRNYPFLMGNGVWMDSENLGPDDEVREALKHGTLSIGFIGLAETLKALTGFHHGESERAQNLGLDIVAHMRKRMDDESRKRRMNFTLIATPAEGLSGRFATLDREQFGEVAAVTDKEFYTNSFHIPVYFPIAAYDKIRLEAPYHELTNAGHITYVELDGDTAKNIDAFEKIIRCMHDMNIGYGSINHPIDSDPVCGYTGIVGEYCPKCGRQEEENGVPFDRIRRITGYLVGTLERFNNAKLAEVRHRVRHGLTGVIPDKTDAAADSRPGQ
ncbi:MAG: anaerobic ribonucleoside triphosphate reductase [Gracilibacteraceae bacterium]|jgi:ribonucleoside-triphosphate reductase|nr:anaerobic ribonucleoside triphosphate reductase [Gracilibacteraceae bacterium]